MAEGTDYKIIKALEDWEAKAGSLPESLQLYRKLLGIQTEARSRIDIAGLGLTREVINERVMQGHPVLKFDDLCLDWSLLAEALEKVASLIAGYAQIPGELPSRLKASPPADLLQSAVKAWFEGTQLPRQLTDGAEEDILEVIFSAVLKPFLSRHCEVLLPLVSQEQWRRGYCPICGGSPDFAFLDKERGARWLLCSRCDARWLFQRMECHSCGNQNQNELAYFTDDKGLYRLYVCERCQCYLKAIDLRQSENEVLLPLERFITLDMDKQAHDKGYVACVRTQKVVLTDEGG